MLADHSYDHMFHNSPGPKGAYQDVENDLRYFGMANSDPVEAILESAGVDRAYSAYARWTMNSIVRMPYSNNWRVWLAGAGAGAGTGGIGSRGTTERRHRPRLLRHDCGECTVPAQSGRRALAIADTVRQTEGRMLPATFTHVVVVLHPICLLAVIQQRCAGDRVGHGVEHELEQQSPQIRRDADVSATRNRCWTSHVAYCSRIRDSVTRDNERMLRRCTMYVRTTRKLCT